MTHQIAGTKGFRSLLFALLVVLLITSLCVGVKDFSILALLKGSQEDWYLAVISRLPRTMAILISGAGLSMAGLIMQTITGNKYVSPTTAGTSEWCRFGVMLAILCSAQAPPLVKVGFAFVVALSGTMIFMGLLQRMQFKNAFMVPLIGMMLGSVVNSITTFVAYQYEIIQNISSWLQGNFSLVVKGRYEMLYLGIPALLLTYLYANWFTIAGMGENFSVSLGLNYKAIVMAGMMIVTFLTSLIVVTIGNIPFIGLIIPNFVSILKGDNVRGTLFETVLLGAIFLLACDLIGRVIIAPYEVNVSVVVSIVGSILFIMMLFRRKVS